MRRMVLCSTMGGLLLTACGSTGTSGAAPGAGGASHHVRVVAAENFWGSIAAQLGGSAVSVTSVLTDPNADPHSYEASTGTARAMATADYVIVNGAGYDGWANRLIAANPSDTRTVLTIADLLGRHDGDNPHFWYSPDAVEQVVNRITADLTTIDPSDSSYYSGRHAEVEAALQPYRDHVAAIRTAFAGRKVAATETVVVYLCDALGLTLISPPEFMKAVAEGNDPPADSVVSLEASLQNRNATLLLYNRQTATDVTNTIQQMAAQRGIPVVGVTETIQPPEASFQDWQISQLTDIESALRRGLSPP